MTNNKQKEILDRIVLLEKENERMRALLFDIDAQMRKAWVAGILPADAWPVDLARRLTAELKGGDDYVGRQ